MSPKIVSKVAHNKIQIRPDSLSPVAQNSMPIIAEDHSETGLTSQEHEDSQNNSRSPTFKKQKLDFIKPKLPETNTKTSTATKTKPKTKIDEILEKNKLKNSGKNIANSKTSRVPLGVKNTNIMNQSEPSVGQTKPKTRAVRTRNTRNKGLNKTTV